MFTRHNDTHPSCRGAGAGHRDPSKKSDAGVRAPACFSCVSCPSSPNPTGLWRSNDAGVQTAHRHIRGYGSNLKDE